VTERATSTYRVLLVDDHQIVRRGLHTVLEQHGRLSIVGEAGTVRDGVSEAARLRPDVIVMDLRLPDGSGIEACREIRSADPDAHIVILTSFADDDALVAAVLAGAAAYVLKDIDPTHLEETLIAAARGDQLLDAAAVARNFDRLRHHRPANAADDAYATLTPQEERILTFIGEGMTNLQIAETLQLTEKTVKNYVSQVYSKLHVARRPMAARLATEHRLRPD
jgi:DNA-binding NarL/FixJ family response regulator